MKILLSSENENKDIGRQLSFGKKSFSPLRKKKISQNIDRASFKLDVPIDQRIKMLCTPQGPKKKESIASPGEMHNIANGNHLSFTNKTPQRRKSLIEVALKSDEFFVESMKEFKSFRQTVETNRRKQSNDYTGTFSSFKPIQSTNNNPTLRKSQQILSIPSLKNHLIKTEDSTPKQADPKFRNSDAAKSDYTFNSQMDQCDRKMRRFNSVYDSLSDDEDESNTKTQFEYNESKFIFDLERSYFILYWNYLIFGIVIYSTLYSPFDLAFNDLKPQLQSFDLTCDLLMFSDIIITLFTPYIQDDIIVKNFTEIYMHYIKTFFFFDLIISLPYELLYSSGTAVYNGLKWMRIFRVVKLYAKERNIQFSSRNLRMNIAEFKFIVVLFIVFFIIIHYASCIWVYLAVSNNDPINWLVKHSPNSQTQGDIYIASLYFVVVTILGVGYGDIYGENDREVFFTIVLMLLGQLLFSFVLGSLSRLFEIFNSQNIQIEAKMEQLNEISLKYHINKTLKANITRSIKQKIKKLNVDYYSFIDSLHKKLKSQLILQMHRNQVKDLNFFNEQKYDFIVYVLPLMQRNTFHKNEFLFSIGDKINEMYLVTKGCLSLKLGSAYDNIEIGQIRQRNHFGEIQLHFQSQSVYDLKAKRNTEVFMISRKDFMQIEDNFPDDIHTILRQSIIIMEIFETRKGLILLLVAYGFAPSMVVPLLRKVNSLILREDFEEYYFNNKDIRETYAFINTLDEAQIIKLINDTFRDSKVKSSIKAWVNPRENLINVRTKAIIQKLLSFNQGKTNEKGVYDFESNDSDPPSEEEKTLKELNITMNDSLKKVASNRLSLHQLLHTKTSPIPIDFQRGGDLKLSQLKREISLKKKKGKHDVIDEIRNEISSLQKLNKEDIKQNRERLPLWEVDISQVRKDAKKRYKFSKENRDKILRKLRNNLDVLNSIYSIYKMLSIKNQIDL